MCFFIYWFTQSLKLTQKLNVSVNVAYVAHCVSFSTSGVIFISHCLATGVIALNHGYVVIFKVSTEALLTNNTLCSLLNDT
jgi:hypothetical protein